MKYLSVSVAGPSAATLHHLQQSQHAQNTPAAPQASQLQSSVGTTHLRQVNLPLPSQGPQPQSSNGAYSGSFPPFQHQHSQAPSSHQQQPSIPSSMSSSIHQQWYPGIAAPQASHPATIPQPPLNSGPQDEKTTPPAVSTGAAPSLSKSDQWDELYLSVLTSQDVNKLRDLLARTNPEMVLPLNGAPLVSQAVILTLVHRVRYSCTFYPRCTDNLILLFSPSSFLELSETQHPMMSCSRRCCGGYNALPVSSVLMTSSSLISFRGLCLPFNSLSIRPSSAWLSCLEVLDRSRLRDS